MNLIAFQLSKQNRFTKFLLLRFSLLFVFCSVSLSIHTQNGEELDSLLIDRDIENYSIRLFTNYKVNKFSLENKGYKMKFTPTTRHGIGLGLANRKIILDIAFKL